MRYFCFMQKISFILLLTILFFSCSQESHSDNTKALQSRIDTLEKKLADTYKPDFGEFMSTIQVHHAKLWFAGQNQNWKLADFEVHEIMEALDGIQKFRPDRKESQKIGMLSPAIDSINNAINKKDPALFKRSFNLLTNTCNDCHHSCDYEFNVVKIPETPPFSNQDFKSKAN